MERPSVRSYSIRGSRITDAQREAKTALQAVHGIEFKQEFINQKSIFPSSDKVIMEIGFGMGESTAHIAGVRPNDNFLCCEVHMPGVGALLKRIGEQDIQNIRIVAHDAVEVLDNMLTPDSLDGVHIFFPDPWHKKRHHKRRLIQDAFVAKLVGRLKIGGYLHCATDWGPYAEQIRDVLTANPNLVNTSSQTDGDRAGYADKPSYRPLTKFENRGLKLGHGVWDLVFTRAT